MKKFKWLTFCASNASLIREARNTHYYTDDYFYRKPFLEINPLSGAVDESIICCKQGTVL